MKTRIKELRQEKKYTQELLALKAETNQTLLSRIECGLAVPDADLIVRLSATFHVSADYILCLSDQRCPVDQLLTGVPYTAAVGGSGNTAQNMAWQKAQLSLFQRLNPTQRTHLQNFLESITGSI